MVETPHIKLSSSEGFAKTVLMPGDPLRAEFIAKNFLSNPVLVNDVRGVHGYTGFYDGVKVSVMASGMGMPSIGIYAQELYESFGVENIIRVGSAGSLSEKCKVGDIVIGLGASTNSSFLNKYGLNGTVAPVCSYDLLKVASETSAFEEYNPLVGPLFSTDTFYADYGKSMEWARVGCLAVEMEAAALYAIAQNLDKRALAVCTISDLCYEPFTSLSADEREKGFARMIKLALSTAFGASFKLDN